MATPEEQATIDAMTDLASALTALNTIITATAGGGAAWDTATAAQRTTTINTLARVARGTAQMLKGLPGPLGSAQVPN